MEQQLFKLRLVKTVGWAGSSVWRGLDKVILTHQVLFLQVDIASGMAIEHMCYAQVCNDCWFEHACWGISKHREPHAV